MTEKTGTSKQGPVEDGTGKPNAGIDGTEKPNAGIDGTGKHRTERMAETEKKRCWHVAS